MFYFIVLKQTNMFFKNKTFVLQQLTSLVQRIVAFK